MTKNAKLEVLLNYWDKLFGQIQLKASQNKDNKTKLLCKNIAIVE